MGNNTDNFRVEPPVSYALGVISAGNPWWKSARYVFLIIAAEIVLIAMFGLQGTGLLVALLVLAVFVVRIGYPEGFMEWRIETEGLSFRWQEQMRSNSELPDRFVRWSEIASIDFSSRDAYKADRSAKHLTLRLQDGSKLRYDCAAYQPAFYDYADQLAEYWNDWCLRVDADATEAEVSAARPQP